MAKDNYSKKDAIKEYRDALTGEGTQQPLKKLPHRILDRLLRRTKES